MVIHITKNVISAADLLLDKEKQTFQSCHDPVSLALNIQTDFHGWFTNGERAILIYNESMSFDLPDNIKKFLKNWELRNKVSPTSFDIPDYVKSM